MNLMMHNEKIGKLWLLQINTKDGELKEMKMAVGIIKKTV